MTMLQRFNEADRQYRRAAHRSRTLWNRLNGRAPVDDPQVSEREYRHSANIAIALRERRDQLADALDRASINRIGLPLKEEV